jgi:hypothetical protein
MRNLLLCACALAALVLTSSLAAAAQPSVGTLSVERARGVVMVDLRGSLLGRLGTGTLRVTDLTPHDRYSAMVVGRKLTQERIGPRTVLYRGQGLRFRMLGGRYRVVARGAGISVSAVGRGNLMLDAEPRFTGDDVGVYSLDGVDCGLDPMSCTPLPATAEKYALAPAEPEGPQLRGPQ